MRKEEIIDEAAHTELKQITRDATSHKELKMERHYISSKRNEEQIAADIWFEGLKRRGKLIVNHISSERPEMSKVQLKEMVQHRIKRHDKKVLDAIMWVAKELRVPITEEISREIIGRKKERVYETPEKRDRKNRRSREQRAERRQTTN
jgi:hypothetical protein